MDIGGGTKYRNDVLLDGTPLTAGNKLGYTPPMDSVSEYTIQQNSVDAEFGHSAGGIAIVTMKSGSNDVKGSAYFFGRDASLNAMSDRATQRHNDNPYWNAGATLGLPIKKNKLFLFAVFDAIENTQSAASNYTLPTELERQGDFSQSYNANGTLRVIYDPLTSRTVNGVQVRDPFPGQQDPRESLGPRGRADPGRPLGSQQRGRRRDRLQQLQGPGRADLPLPQLLDPPRLEHQRPLEGLRARQPHEDGPGRERLHGRQRPAEAAQHHRVAAQRLEHRRRHRLHLQPLDDAERPRVLLPGRGQARVPRHGRGRGGLREPVAERLVAAVRRGPAAHLLALPRRGQHRAGPVRGRELLVPAAQGLQRPRAAQQVPDRALDQGRHRDPLEARRRGALLLHRPALPGGRDGQPVDEPDHDHRAPVGELPARGHGPRHLERAVPAAADRQHRVLRLLRPGRLEGHPEDHAQPGAALRVPGRPVGPRVPAPAAARPHGPHPGDGRDDRPEDPRRHPGDHGPVGGRQGLHLQRCLLLHRGGQQEEDGRLGRRVHAAHRPRVAARREDRPPGRLRAVRHPHRARQLGARHPGRDRPRRLQPDHERHSRTSTASRSPSSPTRSRRA